MRVFSFGHVVQNFALLVRELRRRRLLLDEHEVHLERRVVGRDLELGAREAQREPAPVHHRRAVAVAY